MKGFAPGGVARANGASRGGTRGGRASCTTRGGSEAAWEPVPMAVGLAGIENRGGGAAALRGGRVRRQRGKEWVQGELRRLRGAPIGSAGGRWAGKPAAVAAAPKLQQSWR